MKFGDNKIRYKVLSLISANTNMCAWFINKDEDDLFVKIEAWGNVIWTDPGEEGHENVSGFIATDSGLVPADTIYGFEGYVITPGFASTKNPFIRY